MAASNSDPREDGSHADSPFEAARQTLTHAARLEKTITNMLDAVKSGAMKVAELQQSLEMAREECMGLMKSHRGHIDAMVYQSRLPEESAALPQKVFNIPELLEMILAGLPIFDLLRAKQVNSQGKEAIDTSVTLQRKLALEPESADGCWLIPHENTWTNGMGGFKVSAPQRYDWISSPNSQATPAGSLEMSVEIVAYFGHSSGGFPTQIGAHVRKMLIPQQPVITTMDATTECCHGPWTSRYPHRFTPIPVNNPKGPTIGDLYEAHKRIEKEHANCENASSWQLDRITGSVKANITFRGTVKLDESDPFVEAYVKGEAKRKQDEETSRRLEAFAIAKRAAYDAEEPIPTYDEWKRLDIDMSVSSIVVPYMEADEDQQHTSSQ